MNEAKSVINIVKFKLMYPTKTGTQISKKKPNKGIIRNNKVRYLQKKFVIRDSKNTIK